jgi:AcrR family transcriptional regulator
VPGREQSQQPDDPGQLGPLPGGRHSIAPDVLAHNQRERLIAAVAELVGKKGYTETTIGEIADAASVSRRTLYEHFSGKEDCFLAAYVALDDYVAKLMADAAAAEAEWPGQIAAAFAALIRFLASRPNFARLYLVEFAAAGEALVGAREKTTERFIALLAPGRDYTPGEEPAAGIEEALVGGIVVLLGRRVVGGEAAQLAIFIPAVIEFVLSPYLDFEIAREVAAQYS